MTSSNHHGSRSQTNGVLQVTASQTTGAKHPPNKAAGPKLKVVIRRLAPGLTEAEFKSIIGDDWKLGGGRVDWLAYKPGKDSKDPSKPSRPSRAYLHLTNETYLLKLSETVRQLIFEDAANTFNSSSLFGPPTVEFAPYGRIAAGRIRVDTRVGTIDQDPEFMDFLESLANPTTSKDNGDEAAVVKGEKVTTTPLVQFLKDKKANKVKEVAASKAAKHARHDSQAAKTIVKSKDASSAEEIKKIAKREKPVEKASREAVKVLHREAASRAAAPVEPSKNPRALARERGSIAAAARILQRDLGLSPGNAHRKAKEHADNAAKSTATEAGPSATTVPRAGSSRVRAARGTQEFEKAEPSVKTPLPQSPVILKKPETVATPVAQASAPKSAPPPSRKPPPIAVPSAGATRAFVKHANPSQGVTELLLKESMEMFGPVSHVEIDKRKGFAYVDFVEPEGLAKAMAANPTKIAQGTVQVLERKDAKPAREPPSGATRGGAGRGGRGGTMGRRGGRGAMRGGAGGDTSSTPAAATGQATGAKK